MIESADQLRSIHNPDWAFHATQLRGTMLDVSLGGVAFVMGDRMAAGRILHIELRHSRRAVAVVRRVLVADCQPHGDDSWRVFCKFVNQLSYEEVAQLSIEPTV